MPCKVCVALHAGYPEQYLARCKLPKSAVQILITQFLTLPNLTPSAAASQLYIALYFVPEGLHGDSDLMKAAVSKGFRQSWVITWAPGHLADVSLQWQRYRAARNALGAVLTASKAKDIAVACKCKMNECQRTLNELIQGQADKVASPMTHSHFTQCYLCKLYCFHRLTSLTLYTSVFGQVPDSLPWQICCYMHDTVQAASIAASTSPAQPSPAQPSSHTHCVHQLAVISAVQTTPTAASKQPLQWQTTHQLQSRHSTASCHRLISHC